MASQDVGEEQHETEERPISMTELFDAQLRYFEALQRAEEALRRIAAAALFEQRDAIHGGIPRAGTGKFVARRFDLIAEMAMRAAEQCARQRNGS